MMYPGMKKLNTHTLVHTHRDTLKDTHTLIEYMYIICTSYEHEYATVGSGFAQGLLGNCLRWHLWTAFFFL